MFYSEKYRPKQLNRQCIGTGKYNTIILLGIKTSPLPRRVYSINMSHYTRHFSAIYVQLKLYTYIKNMSLILRILPLLAENLKNLQSFSFLLVTTRCIKSIITSYRLNLSCNIINGK